MEQHKEIIEAMEIRLKAKDHHKYLIALQMLGSLTNPAIKPFCDMRNRELEVFAVLLYYYNDKYKNIPEPQRNQLIFSYDTRVDISNRLGNLSIDIVYNLMMDLRKRGLTTKKSIVEKYITNFKELNKFVVSFL